MASAVKTSWAIFAIAVLMVGTAVLAEQDPADPLPEGILVAQKRSGPCYVTITRNDLAHVVRIAGLEPDDVFDLALAYEGQRLVIPITVPAKGIVIVGLESTVRGESIGVGYVDFDARRCRVHMSYPWRSKT